MGAAFADVDVVCLSHLRWAFVFQRPQHLMVRCARERRVFFVEEPVPGDHTHMDLRKEGERLWVAVPHLSKELWNGEVSAAQRRLLAEMVEQHGLRRYLLWYYTPMALAFTEQLAPVATVYDCMDELTGFAGAPPELEARETELLRRAQLVLTGGHSLYEAKRDLHRNVHAFPSSVDVEHFGRARGPQSQPLDQASIPRPRIGYAGVIDERMDLDLLAGVADARPDWNLVMLGPVVKIDEGTLPRRPNIHWLGGKSYRDLPAYMAGWDVAMLPFARNASTRFISPTKTPEYLAAGKPVVSTSIRDVVRTWGSHVRVADQPAEFVAAIDACLREDPGARLAAIDRALAGTSWDATWNGISRLMGDAVSIATQNEGSCTTI